MKATLYMLCGKIAAGKSTLAASLASTPQTVLISEDQWLARLFAGEIQSVGDYVRCAARLRDAMGPHLVQVLRAGVSVVLDFPANTLANRSWMRGIIDEAGAAHELHFLDVADDVCRARLRARNAAGEHEFAASDAEFNLITRHFVPPGPEEGFNVVIHRP